jgi:hypothetical protein
MKTINFVTILIFIFYAISSLLLFNISPTLIITLIFSIIALVITLYFNNKITEFYSYSLLSITLLYLIIQIIASYSLIFLPLALNFIIIIELLICVVFCIVLKLTSSSVDYIRRFDDG